LKTDDASPLDSIVHDIERMIVFYLSDSSLMDCHSDYGVRRTLYNTDSRRKNTVGRKLAIIGFDPDPSDEVSEFDTFCSSSTCCGDSCHLIDGELTVITDGNDDGDSLECDLLKVVGTIIGNIPTTDIEGVNNIYFIPPESCSGSDSVNEEPVIAKNIAENETVVIESDQNVFHKVFWAVSVSSILLCLFCFACVRRRRKLDEKSILEDEDLDQRFLEYDGKISNTNRLSTIDVHSCTSARCPQCFNDGKTTRFVPIASTPSRQSETSDDNSIS